MLGAERQRAVGVGKTRLPSNINIVYFLLVVGVGLSWVGVGVGILRDSTWVGGCVGGWVGWWWWLVRKILPAIFLVFCNYCNF